MVTLFSQILASVKNLIRYGSSSQCSHLLFDQMDTKFLFLLHIPEGHDFYGNITNNCFKWKGFKGYYFSIFLSLAIIYVFILAYRGKFPSESQAGS